jgi:hypothetical protein
MKISQPKSSRKSKDDLKLYSDLLGKRKSFTFKFALNLARRMWEDINSPTSLGLYICAKYGDYASMLDHSIDPHNYIDSETFAYDAQACKFLSKLRVKLPGLDPKQKALETFVHCEEVCSEQNDFWRLYDVGKIELTPSFENLLDKARSIISEILGDYDLDEVLECARFGPGTVAFVPHSQDDYIKLSSDQGLTPNLEKLFPSFLAEFEGWGDSLSYGGKFPVRGKVVNGGKHSLVPKSAKTDRNIEIQPAVNLFLQLGFGQVIRRKLLANGIDLSDQSRNQNLARFGSRSGKYSTIDLSNASDLISSGVVAVLLPKHWYNALSALRTRFIQGKALNSHLNRHHLDWIPLKRFSSMGNGFTFELETLIFYAIAKAVSKGSNVSVYGDDIIVETKHFENVVSSLKLFGFTTNLKKSFGSTTTFRESCGSDYFNGVNVRPYFLKELPSNDAEIIRLANGLYRSSTRRGGDVYPDEILLRSVHRAHARLDPRLFNNIAVGIEPGDGILLGSDIRNGFRVSFISNKSHYPNFYPTKALMLYRLKLRYRESTDSSLGLFSLFKRAETDGHYRATPYDLYSTIRSWGEQPID